MLFGILAENACPLLQLLNYFILTGKPHLWDCGSKQILPNIYGFRAEIIAKYETNKQKISNIMDTDALFELNILAQHYLIAMLFFFLISFSPCVRGTRKQPLICVGCSLHYWVSCAVYKGGFFEIAFSLSTHICLALRRLLTFCLTLTR